MTARELFDLPISKFGEAEWRLFVGCLAAAGIKEVRFEPSVMSSVARPTRPGGA